MLFSKDFLFVHVPKTGGMSVTRWILDNYRGEMTVSLPERDFDDCRRQLRYDDIAPRLTLLPGRRHEVLGKARDVVAQFGLQLSDFERIVAMARHPLSIERSYYHHLQKPSVISRRSDGDADVRAAAELEFEDFVRTAGFFDTRPSVIHRYFRLDGQEPANLHIVRMESLPDGIEKAFAPFIDPRCPLEHQNRSKNDSHGDDLPTVPDALVEPLREKHPFLCELYGV